MLPECPCNYDLDRSACKCVQVGQASMSPVCPLSYNRDGNPDENNCKCTCSRYAPCEDHYEWDSVKCGCFCKTQQDCMSEYHEWDVSQCKCVRNRLCPYGKVLDTRSCTCRCTNTCATCKWKDPATCECKTYEELVESAAERKLDHLHVRSC